MLTLSMHEYLCWAIAAAASSAFYSKWYQQGQEPRVGPFRENTGYLNSLTL